MKNTGMRKRLGQLLAVLVVCAMPVSAMAATEIGNGKMLGIGIEGGNYYQGLSVKYYMNKSHALQFGGAYWLGSGVWVHGEYLMNVANLVSNPNFELPFYVGAGAGLGLFDGAAVNVHANIGLDFQLAAVPLDVFAEFTPSLFLSQFSGLYWGGNSGVRWHF